MDTFSKWYDMMLENDCSIYTGVHTPFEMRTAHRRKYPQAARCSSALPFYSLTDYVATLLPGISLISTVFESYSVNKRKLEFFNNTRDVSGRYAILSHTWGEEEVTFQDIENQRALTAKGYKKIEYTCQQALNDGLEYVWIDTCCIDKKSSAELSEAINSMFQYYSNAAVCYAYLSDVLEPSQIRLSRWFTRGWTLQELIAPREMIFYNQEWVQLGRKSSLAQEIFDITKIDESILTHSVKLQSASVAKRMSWASQRRTSREEDQAYCLLGIFDVNMPLLYGEGEKAFQRLQEEIVRQSTTIDHSILAWVDDLDKYFALSYKDNRKQKQYHSLFSPSPYGFRYGNRIISWDSRQLTTFEVTQQGLRLTVPSVMNIEEGSRYVEAALNCRYENLPMTQIVLRLKVRSTAEYIKDANHQTTTIVDIGLCDRLFAKGIPNLKFQSLDAAEVNIMTRTTLTVARKAPFWPRNRDRVDITQDLGVRPSDINVPVVKRSMHRMTAHDTSYYHGSFALAHLTTNTFLDVAFTIENEDTEAGIYLSTSSTRHVLPLDKSCPTRENAMISGESRAFAISPADSVKILAQRIDHAEMMLWSLYIRLLPWSPTWSAK